MPLQPIAHSANESGVTHDLGQHLYDVAELALLSAESFNSSSYARCAGLWHDLGKNALDFQAKLGHSPDAHIEDTQVSNRVDHSSAGALYALEQFGRGIGLPLAF